MGVNVLHQASHIYRNNIVLAMHVHTCAAAIFLFALPLLIFLLCRVAKNDDASMGYVHPVSLHTALAAVLF